MAMRLPAIDIGIFEFVDANDQTVGFFGRFDVTADPTTESWEFATLFVDYPGLCPGPRDTRSAAKVTGSHVEDAPSQDTLDEARTKFLHTLKSAPFNIARDRIVHLIEGKVEQGFTSTDDPSTGHLDWQCGRKVESLRKDPSGTETGWVYGTRFSLIQNHNTRYGYRDVFVLRPDNVAFPDPNTDEVTFIDTHGPTTHATFGTITDLAAFKAATNSMAGLKYFIRAWYVKPCSLTGYYASA